MCCICVQISLTMGKSQQSISYSVSSTCPSVVLDFQVRQWSGCVHCSLKSKSVSRWLWVSSVCSCFRAMHIVSDATPSFTCIWILFVWTPVELDPSNRWFFMEVSSFALGIVVRPSETSQISCSCETFSIPLKSYHNVSEHLAIFPAKWRPFWIFTSLNDSSWCKRRDWYVSTAWVVFLFQYCLQVKSTYKFYVAGTKQSWNWAYYSCNGFDDPSKAPIIGIQPLWDDLWAQHGKQHIGKHFVVHTYMHYFVFLKDDLLREIIRSSGDTATICITDQCSGSCSTVACKWHEVKFYCKVRAIRCRYEARKRFDFTCCPCSCQAVPSNCW